MCNDHNHDDDNDNDFNDDDDEDDVEDLDLLLKGSVWDDADVENTEEAVDVTLAVRHQSLVKLFFDAWIFSNCHHGFCGHPHHEFKRKSVQARNHFTSLETPYKISRGFLQMYTYTFFFTGPP